jgi:hypothetical protein
MARLSALLVALSIPAIRVGQSSEAGWICWLLRHQRFRFCFLPVLVTKKSENQAKAPLCAAFVEGMREVFGEVTVLYVKEGDFELSESSAGRAEVSSSSSEARPVAGPK